MHKKFLKRTFFLFWLTYAVFVSPQPTSMSLAMLQTTVNAVDQQSLALSPQTSIDIIEIEGQYYSSYAPASWILPLPYYAVLKVGGSHLPREIPNVETLHAFEKPNIVSKEAYYLHLFVVLFLLCPLSAFLLMQIERFALRRGASMFKALCIAGLIGYGTLMFNYTEIYSIRSLAGLIVFNIIFWRLNREEEKRFSFGAAGLLFGLALCVDYASLLLVALSSAFLLRNSARKEICQFGIGLLGMVIVLGCYHFLLYKNPFLTPYHFRVLRVSEIVIRYKGELAYANEYQQGFFLGAGLPNLKVMAALLFTPFKGLFFYCPIVLAGLWGHVVCLKRRIEPWLSIYALGLFGVYLLANSGLKGELYWSGWPCSFGPRYLLATVPFLALGMVHLEWSRWRAVVIGALAALSLLANLLGTMFQDILWRAKPSDPLAGNPLKYHFTSFMEEEQRIPLLANYQVAPEMQHVLFFGLLAIWASILMFVYLKSSKQKSLEKG